MLLAGALITAPTRAAWAQDGEDAGASISGREVFTTIAGTSAAITVVASLGALLCPSVEAACEIPFTTTSLYGLTSSQSFKLAVGVFLQENAVALSHDIAVGGGEALADLAALYRLSAEQAEQLGHALRPRRHVLWAILQGERKIDDAQTIAFTVELAQALGLSVSNK